VSVLERLNALDRRFVRDRSHPATYDAPVPWWLTHAWLGGVVWAPLSVLLLLVLEPLAVIGVFLAVMAAWVAVAVAWARRHRLPPHG
jgi:hypothetical protein